MCVICYIPKGVETPSKEILTAMHKANPHGLGMCTPSTSYRGMSLDAMLRKLNKRSTDEPALLHFRWATHGSIKRANCHPFHDDETDTWFMHNGILNVAPAGDMTDSETAFRHNLVPALGSGIDSRKLYNAVRKVIGCSRFAFMQGGDVAIFGQYLTFAGCYYSNLRFLSYLK